LGAIFVLTGLGIRREAGMHEVLQSQGIGRCVVCASRLSDAVLVLSKVKRTGHFEVTLYFTKQLIRTRNNDEINQKCDTKQNRAEQIKTNEEEPNQNERRTK
jgi:hypothetical protein